MAKQAGFPRPMGFGKRDGGPVAVVSEFAGQCAGLDEHCAGQHAGSQCGHCLLQGLREFKGSRIYWWPECSIAGATIAAVIYFRYATDNINARILAMGLALGCIGIACGITLLAGEPRDRRNVTMVTALVFLLGGAVQLARGVYIFVFAPVTGLFDTSWPNAILFLGSSLAIVAWSFGFLVLTSEQKDPASKIVAEAAPTEIEVREQLKRIVESELFRRSARMERFLTLAVERSLSGRPEDLKEYVIGRDVFNRGEQYDPRMDSIVRVEAQRLRRKLREYYETLGAHDAVLITLPPGSYVPQFEYRAVQLRQRVTAQGIS